MKEKIIEIIADYKGVDPSTISSTAGWQELGFDSLDIAELMIRVEDAIGKEVELSPEIGNIDALVKYIGE